MFDVELDVDGQMRSMKLPYNAGADPWFAARQFLERNEISQMYLDQVANFIMNQTKGTSITQAVPTASDPFTGLNLLFFFVLVRYLSKFMYHWAIVLQEEVATFLVLVVRVVRNEDCRIRSRAAVVTFLVPLRNLLEVAI